MSHFYERLEATPLISAKASAMNIAKRGALSKVPQKPSLVDAKALIANQAKLTAKHSASQNLVRSKWSTVPAGAAQTVKAENMAKLLVPFLVITKYEDGTKRITKAVKEFGSLSKDERVAFVNPSRGPPVGSMFAFVNYVEHTKAGDKLVSTSLQLVPQHLFELTERFEQSNGVANLLNGLIPNTGKPVPVASSSITKSRMRHQLREEQPNGPEFTSNNSRNRGLRTSTESKRKTSTHRKLNFLPQE